jgi:cell division protein FtsB
MGHREQKKQAECSKLKAESEDGEETISRRARRDSENVMKEGESGYGMSSGARFLSVG